MSALSDDHFDVNVTQSPLQDSILQKETTVAGSLLLACDRLAADSESIASCCLGNGMTTAFEASRRHALQ
jgi:hypothetical protein